MILLVCCVVDNAYSHSILWQISCQLFLEQVIYQQSFPGTPVLQGFTIRKNILKYCKKKKSIGSRGGKMPQKCQVFRHQINFFTKKMGFSPVTIRIWTIVKKCQVFRHPFWGEIFGMNFAYMNSSAFRDNSLLILGWDG